MGSDKLIASGGPWEDSVGYSRATVAGPHVFVSGSTATIDGVLQHPGDAYHQAKVALTVIAHALEQAGHTLSDVVRTRMYLARHDDMGDVGRAHAEVFGSIRPAATMIAGMSFVHPDMLVEIEADSYRSET